MFLVGIGKSRSTTSFLDAQEVDSWSTWKASVFIYIVYCLKKFFILIETFEHSTTFQNFDTSNLVS